MGGGKVGRTAEDGVVKSMAGLSGTWDGACTYDVRKLIIAFASLPPSSAFLGTVVPLWTPSNVDVICACPPA